MLRSPRASVGTDVRFEAPKSDGQWDAITILPVMNLTNFLPFFMLNCGYEVKTGSVL